MSDVRRAYLTGHDEEVLLYDSGGPFAIVPWEEWERLQAVVDAARPAAQFCRWCCDRFFDWCDIDGGDAQDKMAELGLLEQRPTPEDSEWYGECDSLYFETDALRALAREVKPCPLCDGSGLDESGERQCQRCNGRGRLDGEVKP